MLSQSYFEEMRGTSSQVVQVLQCGCLSLFRMKWTCLFFLLGYLFVGERVLSATASKREFLAFSISPPPYENWLQNCKFWVGESDIEMMAGLPLIYTSKSTLYESSKIWG